MVEQSCGNCCHFRQLSEEAGECRRHPPQIVVITHSAVQPQLDPRTGIVTDRQVTVQKPTGVFPGLRTDDPGCGEHQPTEEAVQQAAQEAQAVQAPARPLTMHDQ